MYGHRLLRELIGLLFLFCGLLMLLSLCSYSAGDPSFNHAVTLHDRADIQNAAGLFGAYLAGSMVEAFGMASWLWVIFFLAIGGGLITHWVVLKWYRWIGYLLLFLCMVAISQTLDLGLNGIHGGGFAGKCLTLFCSGYLSSGSLILWLFLFILALELSFETSVLGLTAAALVWAWKKLAVPDAPAEAEEQDGGTRTPLFQRARNYFTEARARAERTRADSRKLDIMLPDSGRKSAAPPDGLRLAEDGDADSFPAGGGTQNAPAPQDAAPASPSGDQPQEGPSFVLEEVTDGLPEARPAPSDGLLPPPEPAPVQAAVPQEEPAAAPAAAPAEEPLSGTAPESKNIWEGIPALPVLPDHPAAPVQDAAPEAAPMPAEPETVPVSSVISAPSVPSAAERPAVRSIPAGPGTSPDAPPTLQDAGAASRPAAAPRQGPEAAPSAGSSLLADRDALVSLERVVGETMAMQNSLAEKEPEPPAEKAELVLPKKRQYTMPTADLLDMPPASSELDRPDREKLMRQGEAVITCLRNFHVDAELAKITPGPVVTMFELRPAPGVKATRITNLANDLAMSLKAFSVRMQAPVPGTDTVGVEVPNEKRQMVYFRDIIENESFRNARSLLTVALGKDAGGRPVSADLAKMPHLLVAGATGKGKSVCLNAILLSLLFRARPDEVQLILIDPKRVEFSMYANLPHLVHPVITDMDIAKNALLWAGEEMDRRMKLFEKAGVRNITGYRERVTQLLDEAKRTGSFPENPLAKKPEELENLPFIVFVIDELADLMQTRRKEVEGPIARLASLARASGIHLIVATQRPSVDVVTGLIKVNFPCRIAFQVTNGQDSRTILDTVGAEKLLGNGDMLFKPTGDVIQRLHGAFVSDREVNSLVGFWKKQQVPDYQVDFANFDEEASPDDDSPDKRNNDIVDDPVYSEAIEYVLASGRVSISGLQRRFRIGYNRAARFVDQMEIDGIVTAADGSKQRMVRDRRDDL